MVCSTKSKRKINLKVWEFGRIAESKVTGLLKNYPEGDTLGWSRSPTMSETNPLLIYKEGILRGNFVIHNKILQTWWLKETLYFSLIIVLETRSLFLPLPPLVTAGTP
jgi:hypothetical protein